MHPTVKPVALLADALRDCSKRGEIVLDGFGGSPPMRKPFHETKLRIDVVGKHTEPDKQLVRLLIEAQQVRELVMASPELSLNQLGKRESRCRTQLAKYLRLSWLSPRIVEAILAGNQPKSLKRMRMLNCDLPVEWREQEQLLGFTAEAA